SEVGRRCRIAGLGSSVASFQCMYVRRDANSLAHCLAGLTSGNNPLYSWSDNFPDWIREIADKDCNLGVN
uniref:RNase H type-1 domain-containing protein n=1 Tax=Setaria italica TaxID=4555 RepID=K4A0B2_SETIT